MIKFLLTGLLRDKSRSLLPVLVVTIGVMLTVLMHAYITGFMGDTLELSARFSYGHLKVMTRGYAEEMQQIPNDLALAGTEELTQELKERYPVMTWSPRIQFGGLIDAPDENGETRAQGPAAGIGADLLSEGTPEPGRLNIINSLVRGSLPSEPGEALLSEPFSVKLGVNPGDPVTFMGSTMHGSMTMYNFIISGTVSTGQEALDRGLIIADIEDVRMALDMEDAAGEILGFFGDGFYDNNLAKEIAEAFNASAEGAGDDYTPVIRSLGQQGTMGQYVGFMGAWSWYISAVFVFAMALVLWNAGLLGGLRRYGEVGLRLAIGEEKGHIYRTLIYESVMIGIIGSITGTAIGLFFAWLLQKYGIGISGIMDNAAMLLPDRIRARITPADYWIGFIPGLLSTVIGTMLSGIGIYKRQTSSLFKELEA
ncbi:MAG: FtsX-like permease family protein [Bacteroidales bacterium]|jgi:putative ABC transport system permease protein|nr:FtsX-like permease family protein [Bacteroidales bacterium]